MAAERVQTLLFEAKAFRRRWGWLLLSYSLACGVAPKSASEGDFGADPVLTLTVSPASQLADGKSAIALHAVLRDGTAKAIAGAQVTLSSDDPTLVLEQPPITAADGTAVGQARRAQPGQVTLTATSEVDGQSVRLATPVVLQFLDGPAPSAGTANTVLSLTMQPNLAVADGTAQCVAVLNAVGGDAKPFYPAAVRWSGLAPSDVVSANAPTEVAVDGSWRLSFGGTQAGARQLTVEVGGAVARANCQLVAGPVDLQTSTLSVEPRVGSADWTDALAIQVRLRDAHANPLANQVVALASSSPNVLFEPTSAVSDPNGAIAVQLRTSYVGTVDIAAGLLGACTGRDANGLPLGTGVPSGAGTPQLVASAVFEVGPPAVATSSLSPPTQSTVASGVDVAQLVLSVRDAAGHPLVGRPVSLRLGPGTSGQDPPTGTLTANAASTDANGALSIAATTTTTGELPVSATVGGLTLATLVPFVAGPPSPNATTLLPTHQNIVLDGASSGSLSFHVEDAFGHRLVGVPVTFSSPFAGLYVLPSTTTTDAQGNASCTITGSRAGGASALAAVGNLTLGAQLYLTAGPASVSRSTLVASPSEVAADGASLLTVTATLRDRLSNPSVGVATTFVNDGSAIVSNNASATGDASGTSAAKLSSTVAQQANVQVVLQDGTLTAHVSFRPGQPDANRSTFTFSPHGGVPADGTTHAQLNFVARDPYGNAVPNQYVTFAVDDANAVLSASDGVCGVNGALSIAMSSTHVATVRVTATFGSLSTTVDVPFLAVPPATAANEWSSEGLTAPVAGSDLLVRRLAALVAGEPMALGGLLAARFIPPEDGDVDASEMLTLTPTESRLEADVDGDGLVDVVTSSVAPGQKHLLRWARNLGADEFSASDIAVPSCTEGIGAFAAHDLDADGQLDLVVVCASSPVFVVKRGLGGGAFAADASFVRHDGAQLSASNIFEPRREGADLDVNWTY